MTDCYEFKHPQDISRNFYNNMDIIIETPRFHTEVLWDLGRDYSNEGNFQNEENKDLNTKGLRINEYQRLMAARSGIGKSGGTRSGSAASAKDIINLADETAQIKKIKQII